MALPAIASELELDISAVGNQMILELFRLPDVHPSDPSVFHEFNRHLRRPHTWQCEGVGGFESFSSVRVLHLLGRGQCDRWSHPSMLQLNDECLKEVRRLIRRHIESEIPR